VLEETGDGSLDGHKGAVEHMRIFSGRSFAKTRLKQPRLVVRAVRDGD
jgi:hypothetical protein